ncbi:hypothetical protein RN001_002245, partial [Aquatica leii]
MNVNDLSSGLGPGQGPSRSPHVLPKDGESGGAPHSFGATRQGANMEKDVAGGAPKSTTPNPEKRVLPQFWIVKKEDGDFLKESPFVIYKQIFGYIGEPKLIRKVKEGLLVETVSAAQASRLACVTKLGATLVKVILIKGHYEDCRRDELTHMMLNNIEFKSGRIE